jgi:hypothetical protein
MHDDRRGLALLLPRLQPDPVLPACARREFADDAPASGPVPQVIALRASAGSSEGARKRPRQETLKVVG